MRKTLTINDDFSMKIEEVFDITGHGAVITGLIHSGKVVVGDMILISAVEDPQVTLAAYAVGVEMFTKLLDQGEIGDNVGLLLKGVTAQEIKDILPYKAYAFKDNGDQLILSTTDIAAGYDWEDWEQEEKEEKLEGKIRCPHCGKIYVVPEEDLLDEIVTYHCNNCGENFKIGLFGFCKECDEIVGLEHSSLKEILSGMAEKAIENYNHPWKGFRLIPRLIDDVPSSDSWGKCPFCNKEYIRCPNCHDLVVFPPGTDDEAILRCPKCGQRMRHS